MTAATAAPETTLAGVGWEMHNSTTGQHYRMFVIGRYVVLSWPRTSTQGKTREMVRVRTDAGWDVDDAHEDALFKTKQREDKGYKMTVRPRRVEIPQSLVDTEFEDPDGTVGTVLAKALLEGTPVDV